MHSFNFRVLKRINYCSILDMQETKQKDFVLLENQTAKSKIPSIFLCCDHDIRGSVLGLFWVYFFSSATVCLICKNICSG